MRKGIAWAAGGWGVALLAVTGCSGPQHILDPRGPAAARIEDLWWLMFGLAAAVSVVVTILLLWAALRSHQRNGGRAIGDIDGRRLIWGGGVVVPLLIVLPLLFFSHRIGISLYPPVSGDEPALTIEVIGHQYWWEVRYPQHGISTANEIHIPVGQRVRFRLRAPDVIHSFWVPQLHGKMDMVPGRVTTLWVQAAEAGEMRGQCAEFCGMGHALMAFWVVALPPAAFDEWVREWQARQLEPTAAAVQRGRETFLSAGCGLCHATRDELLPPQAGAPGPNLSNVATRRTLAAGTLPNTRDHLEAFIRDPEAIKPGSRMPPTDLPASEMGALLDYLQSLR